MLKPAITTLIAGFVNSIAGLSATGPRTQRHQSQDSKPSVPGLRTISPGDIRKEVGDMMGVNPKAGNYSANESADETGNRPISIKVIKRRN